MEYRLREIRSGKFLIYVFAKNIAENLPGWDTSYKKSALFLPGESTLRRIGQAEDGGGNTLLVADKGQRGLLYRGSPVEIDPGEYRATFDIKANYDSEGVARIDIASISKQITLGEMELQESQSPRLIEFTINTRDTIQLEVWALGNVTVSLKSITLMRRSD